jgi:glycogen phosphorylase
LPTFPWKSASTTVFRFTAAGSESWPATPSAHLRIRRSRRWASPCSIARVTFIRNSIRPADRQSCRSPGILPKCCDRCRNKSRLRSTDEPFWSAPGNTTSSEPPDAQLSDHLYSGDQGYRLAQEAVLGIAGVRMLKSLGFSGIEKYHLNEGHAGLLTLELLRADPELPLARRIEEVRRRCIFTTHTPVPAGHDQFPYELVQSVLGDVGTSEELKSLGGRDRLNMTLLALNLSHYVNGVAKSHGFTSQRMFHGYPVDSITNGVHSHTWTSPSFRRLYDQHIPGWMTDSFSLRHAQKIPPAEIWTAHFEAKQRLIEEIFTRTGTQLDDQVFTIGFARRATAYKRTDLVFTDPQRLVDMAQGAGKLQFIFAGKAHPRDAEGKQLIERVWEIARALEGDVKVVYLENYDLDLGRLLTSGVDLWLNTPLPPMEASGTSGMKAAHNGVPSFSTLDGWWVEGHVEGITGWSIGPEFGKNGWDNGTANERDAAELYEKLENVILPLFYQNRAGWIDVMRRAIAVNASFFNTHRMVQQYATNAYL